MNEAKWKMNMRKVGATWYYTTSNPQGGSFGSNYCGPKKFALSRALRAVPFSPLAWGWSVIEGVAP